MHLSRTYRMYLFVTALCRNSFVFLSTLGRNKYSIPSFAPCSSICSFKEHIFPLLGVCWSFCFRRIFFCPFLLSHRFTVCWRRNSYSLIFVFTVPLLPAISVPFFFLVTTISSSVLSVNFFLSAGGIYQR